MAGKQTAEELIAQALSVSLRELRGLSQPLCHSPLTAELLFLLGAGVLLGSYSTAVWRILNHGTPPGS
jgi:hypothetical protein